MEPEDLLPCTQEPATGPCPETDESSTQLPTAFRKINYNINIPIYA